MVDGRGLLSSEVGIQGLGSVSWSSRVASPSYFSAGKATDSASVTGTGTAERAAYDAGTRTVDDEAVKERVVSTINDEAVGETEVLIGDSFCQRAPKAAADQDCQHPGDLIVNSAGDGCRPLLSGLVVNGASAGAGCRRSLLGGLPGGEEAGGGATPDDHETGPSHRTPTSEESTLRTPTERLPALKRQRFF